MVNKMSPFVLFALASIGCLVAGTQGFSWSGETETRKRVVVGIEDLGARGLPVLDNVPRSVWGRLGSAANRVREGALFEIRTGDFPKLGVADAEGFRLTVVSNMPHQAVQALKALLSAIEFVPYVLETNNTIFIDRHDDLVFFSGTALPPIAARLTGNGERIGRMNVARGFDGEVLFPGGVAGAIQKVEAGTTPLFVLRKDLEGCGMLERRRPTPQKELLIAWDDDLKQLPTLPFDELGIEDGGLWIQRNVDAFQVPASYEGPWFATSWHCPHFVYQYSFVDPISNNPSVLVSRLYFGRDGDLFLPTRVTIDLVDAVTFHGPSAACQRFLTKGEILGSRFGRYRGEGRTKPGESGSGLQYLEISRLFSLAYLDTLRDAVEGRHEGQVVVTGSVFRAIEALVQESWNSAIDEEAIVEIGGSSPGVYLDALR